MSLPALVWILALSLSMMVVGVWMLLWPTSFERFSWWHFRRHGKWSRRLEERTKQDLAVGKGLARRKLGLLIVRILGVALVILGFMLSAETGWHTFPMRLTDLIDFFSHSR